MGTYVTSNTLIDQVKFENIMRFDSDDIMKPNMVSEIVKYIDNYDIIRFNCDDFVGDINNITTDKSVFPHGVVMYKHDVFKLAGGYQAWVCAADTELIERIKDYIDEKIIQERLFYRRRHENSLTTNPNTNHQSNIRTEYKKLIGKHKSIWIDKKTNSFKEI